MATENKEFVPEKLSDIFPYYRYYFHVVVIFHVSPNT